LEDKKGENILLLDIHEISDFTDYFVICSGTSPRMLRTLAEAAVEEVKKGYGMSPPLEGTAEEGWLLVDYGDVILHIFSPNRRHYYQLEELWGEGKVLVHLQ
jgi:ribosome-associated protein